MQSHNLLEEQFGYMWCIGCLPVRSKVHHLSESINYHKIESLSFVCEEVPTRNPYSNLSSYLLKRPKVYTSSYFELGL